MACNCKHNEKEIESFKNVIAELRELFIKRMTVDSDHNDRRKEIIIKQYLVGGTMRKTARLNKLFLAFLE